MPRFVLLLHECPADHARATHCDLMLEEGDVLRTWSLAKLPRSWAELLNSESQSLIGRDDNVEAVQLSDHRLAYLDYEGPVSGDRGSVRRLDGGTFVGRQESRTYLLDGQVVRGEVTLQRPSADDASWSLVYTPG